MHSLNRKLFFGLTIAVGLALSAGLPWAGGVLWAHETQDRDDSGFLGVGLSEETQHPEGGARVTFVVEDSPADEAGIRKGDIIQHIDRRVIRGPNALIDSIHSKKPGGRVTITVLRDGRKEVFDVQLGNRSEEAHAFAPRVFDGERWEEWGRELQERIQEGIGGLGRREGHGRAFVFGSWNRPRLGVQLVEVTPELRRHLGADEDAGVLVSKVIEGMPAEASGILVGDLIVSADGQPVQRTPDLVKVLRDGAGRTFPIEVYRDGRLESIDVTILEEEDDGVSSGGRAVLAPSAPFAVLPELPTIELPMIEIPTIDFQLAPMPPLPEPPMLDLPQPPAPPAAPVSRVRDHSHV